MRTQSNVSPQPVSILGIDSTGIATVRLTQNVSASTTQTDSGTQTTYTYDEVMLQIVDRPNLETYLQDNAAFYFGQELTRVKNARFAYLESELASTYEQGFSSSAINSTAAVYPFDAISQNKWSWLTSILGAGAFPAAGVQVKDINGTVYTIDATTAKQLATDATNFYLQWDSHYHSLYDQIKNASDEQTVAGVVW